MRPCSGECLCEWPCECACASLTRREVVKERENKRRGDEEEGDWIWPCG